MAKKKKKWDDSNYLREFDPGGSAGFNRAEKIQESFAVGKSQEGGKRFNSDVNAEELKARQNASYKEYLGSALASTGKTFTDNDIKNYDTAKNFLDRNLINSKNLLSKKKFNTKTFDTKQAHLNYIVNTITANLSPEERTNLFKGASQIDYQSMQKLANKGYDLKQVQGLIKDYKNRYGEDAEIKTVSNYIKDYKDIIDKQTKPYSNKNKDGGFLSDKNLEYAKMKQYRDIVGYKPSKMSDYNSAEEQNFATTGRMRANGELEKDQYYWNFTKDDVKKGYAKRAGSGVVVSKDELIDYFQKRGLSKKDATALVNYEEKQGTKVGEFEHQREAKQDAEFEAEMDRKEGGNISKLYKNLTGKEAPDALKHGENVASTWTGEVASTIMAPMRVGLERTMGVSNDYSNTYRNTYNDEMKKDMSGAGKLVYDITKTGAEIYGSSMTGGALNFAVDSADQGYYHAKQNGATDEEALTYGGILGAVTGAIYKFGIPGAKSLFSKAGAKGANTMIGKLANQVVKGEATDALGTAFVKSVGKGALKGAGTFVGISAATKGADVATQLAVLGDKSDYKRLYNTYKEQGFSNDEAWKNTAKDLGQQFVSELAQSAATGAVFGAAGAAAGNLRGLRSGEALPENTLLRSNEYGTKLKDSKGNVVLDDNGKPIRVQQGLNVDSQGNVLNRNIGEEFNVTQNDKGSPIYDSEGNLVTVNGKPVRATRTTISQFETYNRLRNEYENARTGLDAINEKSKLLWEGFEEQGFSDPQEIKDLDTVKLKYERDYQHVINKAKTILGEYQPITGRVQRDLLEGREKLESYREDLDNINPKSPEAREQVDDLKADIDNQINNIDTVVNNETVETTDVSVPEESTGFNVTNVEPVREITEPSVEITEQPVREVPELPTTLKEIDEDNLTDRQAELFELGNKLNLPEKTVKSMIQNDTETLSPRLYANEFAKMYAVGKDTQIKSFDEALQRVPELRETVNRISPQAAGVAFSEGNVPSVEDVLRPNTKPKGKVVQDFIPTAEDSVINKVLRREAKATGLDIIVTDDMSKYTDKGTAQGIAFLDNGKVVLNKDTANILGTADHEILGHFGKSLAPNAYKELANIVSSIYRDELGVRGYDNFVQMLKGMAEKQGVDLSESDAQEEAIAYGLETMAMNTDLTEKFIDKLQDSTMTDAEKKNILDKLKEFISHIINTLKERLKNARVRQGTEGMLREDIDYDKVVEAKLKVYEEIRSNLDAMPETDTATVSDNEGKTKYSFAGIMSETADLAKLDEAKEIYKELSKNKSLNKWKVNQAVMHKTGWFKGIDGEWKYEIDEKNLKLNNNIPSDNIKLSDIIKHKDLFEAYPELKDIKIDILPKYSKSLGQFNPSDNSISLSNKYFINAKAKARRSEIFNSKEYKAHSKALEKIANEKNSEIEKAFNKWVELMKYSDVRDEKNIEELGKAEKTYKKLKKEQSEKLNKQYKKWEHSKLGQELLELDTDKDLDSFNKSMEEGIKNTLIHEIQHAIQNKEGFAGGASPEYWEYIKDHKYTSLDLKEHRKLEDNLFAIKDEIAKEVELGKAIGYFSKLEDAARYENMYEYALEEGDDYRLNDLQELFNDFKQGVPKNIFDKYYGQVKAATDELNNFEKEIRKRNDRTEYDLYQNTAGEIEARDVEERYKNFSTNGFDNKGLPAAAVGGLKDNEDVVFSDKNKKSSKYSLKEEVTDRDIDKYKATRDDIGKALKLTKGSKLDAQGNRKLAAELKNAFGLQNTSVTQIAADLEEIGTLIETKGIRNTDTMDRVNQFVTDLLKSEKQVDPAIQDAIRNIRSQKIYLSDKDVKQITDFKDFWKSAFGNLRLVRKPEGAMAVDEFFEHLKQYEPEVYNGVVEDQYPDASTLEELLDWIKTAKDDAYSLLDMYGDEAVDHYANEVLNAYSNAKVEDITNNRAKQRQLFKNVGEMVDTITGLQKTKDQASEEVLNQMRKQQSEINLKLDEQRRNIERKYEQEINELKSKLANEKSNTQKQIKAIKEKAQARKKRESESRNKSDLRRKIRNRRDFLYKAITNPKINKHIPIPLQKPVKELANAIDMGFKDTIELYNTMRDNALIKYTGERLEEALARIDKREFAWIDKMDLIKRSLEAYIKGQDIDGNELKIKNRYGDSDTFYQPVIDMIEGLMEIGSNTSLMKMDVDQLTALNNTLAALGRSIVDRSRPKTIKIYDENNKELETYEDIAKAVMRQVGNFKLSKADAFFLPYMNGENILRLLGGNVEGGVADQLAKEFYKANREKERIEQKLFNRFSPVLNEKAGKTNLKLKSEVVRQYDKDHLYDVGLKTAKGEKILHNKDNLLDLYMHFENDDNLTHAAGGGIRIPSFKNLYANKSREEIYGKKYGGLRTENVEAQLNAFEEEIASAIEFDDYETLRQIANNRATILNNRKDYLRNEIKKNIESKFDDYDKKLIKAGKDVIEEITNMLNDFWEKKFGYRPFVVDKYWQIVVDPNFVGGGDAQNKQEIITNLSEQGFTIARQVNAKNPILSGSFIDRVGENIERAAKTIAYAGLQRDLNAIMKYTTDIEDDAFHNWKSTAEDVMPKVARNFVKVQQNLFGGANTDETPYDRIVATGRSAVMGGAITPKLNVGLAQLPSVLGVLKYVDKRDLASANLPKNRISRTVNGKKYSVQDVIDKYTAIMYARGNSGFSLETQDLKRDTNKFFRARRKVDRLTHGWIYNMPTHFDSGALHTEFRAILNYVRRTRPDLKEGTPEQIVNGESPLYKEAAKIFEQNVVYTQPMFDAWTKNSLQLAKDPIVKSLASAFKTQPYQYVNLLYKDVAKFNAIKDDPNVSKKTKAKYRNAIFKSASIIIGAMSMYVAFKMAYKATERHNDEDLTPGAIAKNMLGAFAGMFIGGSQIVDAVYNGATGKKPYDVEILGTQIITEAQNLIYNTGKFLKDPAGNADKMIENIEAFANNIGIPVQNIHTEIDGLVRNIEDVMDNNKWDYSNERTDTELIEQYILGDKSLEDLETLGIKLNNDNKTKVTNAFKKLYSEGQITKDQATQKMTDSGLYVPSKNNKQPTSGQVQGKLEWWDIYNKYHDKYINANSNEQANIRTKAALMPHSNIFYHAKEPEKRLANKIKNEWKKTK